MSVLRSVLAWIVELWLSILDGKPCEKHPGHRIHEYDPYLGETHEGQCETCVECWEELKKKYGWLDRD